MQAVLNEVRHRSKVSATRIALTDGAHVMLANFSDERRATPIHLNCAACASVDMSLLYERLDQEFVSKSAISSSMKKYQGDYVWPKDRPFEAYQPPAKVVMPLWVDLALIVRQLSLCSLE